MRIIPAVDVLGGEAVRLLRGDYGAVTAYGPDPAAIVHEFADAGADIVHIVDLEAARGGPRQTETIRAILEVGVRVQIGGGIRTAPDARQMVDEGAARVVVGSALVDGDEAPARQIVEAVGPGAVVAAIDVRQGQAMGSGWLGSGSPLETTLERVVRLGIERMLVTGIERDGTMEGPDVDLLDAVGTGAPGVGLIASGGVGSVGDIVRLRALDVPLEAVIVGRALYEGRFTLREAIAAAQA